MDCYDELPVTNYIGYVVLSFVLSKLLVNLGHGDLFSNYLYSVEFYATSRDGHKLTNKKAELSQS